MSNSENKIPMDLKKLIIIGCMAAAFLLLVVAGISYLVHESSYVIYYDKYYKIHIKYPKEWKALVDYQGSVVTFLSKPDDELDNYAENLSITVSDLQPDIKTLEQFSKIATGQMEAVFEGYMQTVESKAITLAGYPAYLYEVQTTRPTGIDFKFIWFFKDNKAFVITTAMHELQFKKYRGIFKDMIGSFQIGVGQ